ncbi:MAG: EutN/CcmL family microcompartment protein [Elusimicrobia bacterium]|nr:EutN/CcmL family microcompartment protein [Elusimicrobiota bacterium]
MIIAKVIGNTWASRKHPHVNGKLLLVVPIDPMTEKPLGDAAMAVDGGVDAGPGSVVLVVDEGGSARAIIGDPEAPVRTVVCGVVDRVTSGGKMKKYA